MEMFTEGMKPGTIGWDHPVTHLYSCSTHPVVQIALARGFSPIDPFQVIGNILRIVGASDRLNPISSKLCRYVIDRDWPAMAESVSKDVEKDSKDNKKEEKKAKAARARVKAHMRDVEGFFFGKDQ
jgi:hypothetical protein